VAIKQFQEYVLAGIGIKEEIDFEAGCSEGMLGDDDFVGTVRSKMETGNTTCTPSVKLEDLLQSAFRLYGVTEESLCAPGKSRGLAHVRSILAAVVSSSHGVTLQDLAIYLKRDISTMSKAGALTLYKTCRDPHLAIELKQLRRESKAQMPSLTPFLTPFPFKCQA
jgi:hypothetical protein